jgi:ferritin-like metal-binding protein YciE
MATMKGPAELMLNSMQDVHYAERQILMALSKMAKAASSPALADGSMHHRAETGRRRRLMPWASVPVA